VFRPGQGRLGREALHLLAQPRPARMQGDLRYRRPDGEERELRPAASQRGIELESARQRVNRDDGAEAVTGNHDLLGVVAASAGDDPYGEVIESGVHVRAAA